MPHAYAARELCNNACLQGRLSLSTDGDKCAIVNFGENEQKVLY